MKEVFKATKNDINIVHGDVFIVPNHAIKFVNLIGKGNCEKIAADNGVVLSDDTKFIQVWIVSDELGTDNLRDHGAFVLCDGVETRIQPRVGILPIELFDGKKEHDRIYLMFEEKGMDFQMNLQLCQSKYRYKRFGSFEEVLEAVTRD